MKCKAGWMPLNKVCILKPKPKPKPKPCTCSNGLPLKDTAKCNGQVHCKKCSVGFRLDNNTCKKKDPCVCPDGEPLNDPAKCNGQVRCTKCNAGFKLKNKACTNKVCLCPGGLPLKDTAKCRGQTYCTKCLVGFRLDKTKCVKKQPVPCVCPYGFPFQDPLNTKWTSLKCHGQVHCVKCEGGYSLKKNICKKNKPCVCPNGSPLKDKAYCVACPVPPTANMGNLVSTKSENKSCCKCHGQAHCTKCDVGFTKKAGKCKKNKPCVCKDGVALKDIAKCHGQKNCVKCNVGFKKQQKVCVKRKPCRCPHGTPSASKTMCDGQLMCATCQAGYKLMKAFLKLSWKVCVKKKPCTCANGTAKNDLTKCDGQPFCAKCDRGFKIVAQRKQALRTNKSGGKVAFMQKQQLCEKKKPCVCPNGEETKDLDKCDGQTSCAKCNPGFKKKGPPCNPCKRNKPCVLGRERAGLSASERFETGFRPVPCRMHDSPCHRPCPCHVVVRCTVMSDLRSAIMSDLQSVFSDAYGALTEIQDSGQNVVQC